MPKKTPHVALMTQIEATHGRRIMRGIIQYAHAYGHWDVYTDQGIPVITLDKLTKWQGDGIIANIGSEEQLAIIKSKEIPVVNVSNTLSKVELPSVTHDEDAIGRLGAEHFIERGFMYFAFCGDTHFAWSISRRHGFEKAVNKAGYKCESYQDFNKRIKEPRSWQS